MLGASPRIMDVVSAFGTSKEMESWIGNIIRYICQASGVTENADIQIGMTIQLIMTRYKTLKMSELMLFAAKFILGDFEKFYGSYNIQALTRSLTSFTSYRNNIVSKYDIRVKNTTSEKINGKESHEVYLQQLQKALYGDSEAYRFLRIESDEDLAKCVAWCVRRKELPMEILDDLNPKYVDIVSEILYGKMPNEN